MASASERLRTLADEIASYGYDCANAPEVPFPAIIACIENLERFDWDREAQESLRVLNEGLAK